MGVKNVAVYWNFKNVAKDDVVTLASNPPKNIGFEEGYWTFHMLAERLAENDVNWKETGITPVKFIQKTIT